MRTNTGSILTSHRLIKEMEHRLATVKSAPGAPASGVVETAPIAAESAVIVDRARTVGRAREPESAEEVELDVDLEPPAERRGSSRASLVIMLMMSLVVVGASYGAWTRLHHARAVTSATAR